MQTIFDVVQAVLYVVQTVLKFLYSFQKRAHDAQPTRIQKVGALSARSKALFFAQSCKGGEVDDSRVNKNRFNQAVRSACTECVLRLLSCFESGHKMSACWRCKES